MYVYIKFVGFIIFCSITMYLTDFKHTDNKYPIIIINNLTAVRKVSDKFLSVALDTSLIRTGHICCINSEKFLERASALAPAFLRIGGTAADCLIFDEHVSDTNELPLCEVPFTQQELYNNYFKDISNFTMTAKVWRDINKFSEKSDLKLIFDLNVLLRENNKWDSSNAQKLFGYSSHFNHNIVWQLGNEPNSFLHVFGKALPPAQLSDDFQELRRLLNKFPKYNSSLIIGPDVTSPTHLTEKPIHYLQDFLSTLGNSTINAVTWHQYYLHGRSATVQDFISVNTLNTLRKQITKVKKLVQKYMSDIPIWLSETSTASGGGAPGLSDTYIAGFLWLDKLGCAARLGIDVVIRQSLYNGYYSLLDTRTLDPLPDWWLSILYKKLVGSIVLDLEQFVNESETLRIYAHCSSDKEYREKGSVITLFGLNLKDTVSHFQLQNYNSTEPESYVTIYILTGCTGLTSRSICLNEKTLALQPNGSLPEFESLKQDLDASINMPPYSLGFWTLHGISKDACFPK